MSHKDLRKQSGQSIILVAAAMVLLVMFVAIAVDLSSAYYHRRTAQNGADGCALAGVSQMATQINNKKKLDGLIMADMNDFAERNGIQDTDTQLANAVNDNVVGYYVDAAGNRLPEQPQVGNGVVPSGAYGVECVTTMLAPTYFGGIFGVDGLTLHATAVSVLKEICGADCVVPIALERSVLFTGGDPPKAKVGKCFNIWRESQTDNPGSYGWINWTWQESMCTPGDPEGRPCPSVDQGQNACNTGVLDQNLDPRNCASGFIAVGDWVSNATGVMNSQDHVLCWLRYYLGSRDMDCNERLIPEPHEFTIVVYDETNADVSTGECNSMSNPLDPSTGGLHYKVAGFARMQLIGFQLSQGGSIVVSEGNDGYYYINELGQQIACETLGEVPNNGFRMTAVFREYVIDYNSRNACYDPLGTLRASPKLLR